MKLTEDGHEVNDSDIVYEIQWRRYNEEISVAEPVRINASLTDKSIWLYELPCIRMCFNLNKETHYHSFEEPIQTIKMIAYHDTNP